LLAEREGFYYLHFSQVPMNPVEIVYRPLHLFGHAAVELIDKH